MSSSSGGEQVQAYLEKHKISSLFEDLMSKLVKDLPPDPVEFLITKLQLLHRKRKTTSPHSSSAIATPTSRSKMQVTGTAVTSKGNARTSASGTPGGRPKATPTQPTRLQRPTTVTTPTRKAVTTGKPKTIPSAGLRRPMTAPTKTTPSASRPAPTAAGRATGRGEMKGTPTRIPTAGKAAPHTTRTGHGTSKAKPKPGPPTAKEKKVPKPEKPVFEAAPRPEEKLSDFFGEAKKSSGRKTHSASDEEEEELYASGGRMGAEDVGDEDEEGVVDVGTPQVVAKEMDLDEFLRKRLSSKQAKKSHQQRLQDIIAETTPTSSGYISEESEDEEGTLEVAEDYTALEEEGVTGVRQGKYAYREGQSSDGATVDLKVLICARCAKVLSHEEPVSEYTVSEITQATQSGGDFESASQVGSHASFPQWEGGSAVGSELSSVQKWSLPSPRSGDAASDVTLRSHDTWGGLAPPQPRPQPPSDTESEVHLPPPPPLEGTPWVEGAEPQHDPHGWIQEGSQ